jgi:hypothetical protein
MTFFILGYQKFLKAHHLRQMREHLNTFYLVITSKLSKLNQIIIVMHNYVFLRFPNQKVFLQKGILCKI